MKVRVELILQDGRTATFRNVDHFAQSDDTYIIDFWYDYELTSAIYDKDNVKRFYVDIIHTGQEVQS